MTTTITPDQLRALADGAPTKYNSRSVWVEELGRRFASRREADAAVTLWRRQQAGEVRDLRFQVPYRLDVAPRSYVGLTAPVTTVCTYVADFHYFERHGVQWVPVVADAKGWATPLYKLKKRLMKAINGVDVVEL
jgi:hypothetical protein